MLETWEQAARKRRQTRGGVRILTALTRAVDLITPERETHACSFGGQGHNSRMHLRYEEFELTDSAYRHGFGDEDVADMLRGPRLVIRSRRRKLRGYEIFG